MTGKIVPRPSKEVLERMYTNEELIQYQIGERFGVHQGTVSGWLKHYNISTVGRSGSPINGSRVPIPPKEVLLRMYTDEEMYQWQIGKHFGVSQITISVWLKHYKIPTRYTGTLKVEMPSKSELEQLYTENEMSQWHIGEHFGVSRGPVYEWLKYYKISTRGARGTLKVDMPPKSDLENMINEGLNQHQIAKSYEVCDTTVFRWCEQLEIPGMINNFRFMTPEHQNWRREVFKRDHNTCQKCGATKTEIHAHHIVPHYDHPELAYELDNGITLCKRCHIYIGGYEYDYIQQFAAITQPHLRDHDIIESMPWESPLETNSIIDY